MPKKSAILLLLSLICWATSLAQEVRLSTPLRYDQYDKTQPLLSVQSSPVQTGAGAINPAVCGPLTISGSGVKFSGSPGVKIQ